MWGGKIRHAAAGPPRVEHIDVLPSTPRRAMRHLTGPLAKLVEHPTDTGDYIWATLTDPTPLPDAMAALRAAYPNAMRLDYQPHGVQDAAGGAAQGLCAASRLPNCSRTFSPR